MKMEYGGGPVDANRFSSVNIEKELGRKHVVDSGH